MFWLPKQYLIFCYIFLGFGIYHIIYINLSLFPSCNNSTLNDVISDCIYDFLSNNGDESFDSDTITERLSAGFCKPIDYNKEIIEEYQLLAKKYVAQVNRPEYIFKRKIEKILIESTRFQIIGRSDTRPHTNYWTIKPNK